MATDLLAVMKKKLKPMKSKKDKSKYWAIVE